jgi:hypothetical protein
MPNLLSRGEPGKPAEPMNTTKFVAEMQTVKHYINIGIERRKLDALKLALEKSDALMTKHADLHAAVLRDPKTSEDATELMSLVVEGKVLREKLVQENVDSIEFYLKQGLATKNRDILREIVIKSCLFDRSLFNKELLTSGEALLRLLDEHHMAKTTLVDAINSKNVDILNAALANATPVLNSRSKAFAEGVATLQDTKLVEEANKLYAQLIKKQQLLEQQQQQQGRGKKAADASGPVDALMGGDIERIISNFHVIVPMATAVIRSAHVTEDASADLRVEADPLDEAPLQAAYVKVPVLVYDCVQYLRRHAALEEVGIFRQAGSNEAMGKLFEQYAELYTRAKRRGGLIKDDMSKTFAPSPPPSPADEEQSLAALSLAPSSRDGDTVSPSMVYDSFASVNDAATVLKRFFRELADPLVPFSEYAKWLAVAAKCRVDPLLTSGSAINANSGSVLNMTSRANLVPIGGAAASLAASSPSSPSPARSSLADIQTVAQSHRQTLENSAALRELKTLLQNLSTRRYSLLHYLCVFLNCVARHSAVNKMTPDNLAIVFAPNLVKPRVETQATMVSDSPLIIFVVHCLIKYANVLFEALAD